MIEALYIKNYALIEELRWEPSKGFNVITGETGAGKSMILGAMMLAFGERNSSIKNINENSTSIIELFVNTDNEFIKQFFIDKNIDFELPIILRREISPSGRSRAFVNDSSISTADLKNLSEFIVDVNEQHQTLSLFKKNFKLQLLDLFAENNSILEKYKLLYLELTSLEKKISEFENQLSRLQTEQDYFQFQLNELNELNYTKGENKLLEEELELLENAEEIKNSLFTVFQSLTKDDFGIISMLNSSISMLKPASNHHKKAQEIYSKLNEFSYNLSDISDELENEFDKIEYSEERLNEVEERLTLINKLLNKHKLLSAEELCVIKENFENCIASYDYILEEIKKLKNQKSIISVEYNLISKELTKSRTKIIPIIQKEIKNILTTLSMPSANFFITHKLKEKGNEDGFDEIEFLFSANKGIEPQTINKVASGGEMSRLMLAIKSLLSEKKKMPTIIFDEIDTGISGQTAVKVGDLMQKLSENAQLIVISHLPQIAAKASEHYEVIKTDQNDITKISLKKLTEKDRISAIATMLSGNVNSIKAELTAKEMLNS
ncbi:MAG: DNA repair protein RecN [Bacteroidetes bacterium CG2_30_33_31]|nr:MAG: DNA repair protein RecN [Bacteroidetes bacterium CG2_30_33_31]